MKKSIYHPALCLCILLLFVSAVNENIWQRFKTALNDFNVNYASEKIYLQTDKTYYKPTETIWYKGFLSNGTDNKPSVTSDVIYTELHDAWGNVVERHEQNAVSGTFTGAFTLSEDRPGGIYRIISYTGWMKNWGEDHFFRKEITVQKVITPRLLLKVDFEKRAYGPGEEVVANLKVTDLNNIKTTGSIVNSTVRIGGKEFQSLKHTTAEGEVAIRFYLPGDLNTADGILQMIVTDKGVEESISRSIPIVIDKVHIQFFPEGGELVEGTENKVAFEAFNEFGKGADVSGEIIDESGKVVTCFSSFHLGMGAFTFMPEKKKEYYARITAPAGNEDLRKLPEPVEKGYLLSLIRKNEDKAIWKVFSPENNNHMRLVAHTQGIIQCTESFSVKKGENRIEVDTKDFPMGIAVFTLFDNEKEVAERLVFLNPDKRLHINLVTNKEYYDPGEEVELVVKTTDEKGIPIPAHIGLAVVDEQILTMADDKQDNLLSYILLSSELKGKIQEPSFYFDPEESKATEAMDYLMLTHGWRRFNWTEVLTGEAPFEINNPAERTGSIYGFIFNEKGEPVQSTVYLIELGGKKRIAKLKTTEEGHFVFHNVDVAHHVHVTTKLPNRVFLVKDIPAIAEAEEIPQILDSEEGSIVDLMAKPESIAPLQKEQLKMEYDSYGDVETFHSDVQLAESVIIAYGVQRKKTAGSSSYITTTYHNYDFQPLTLPNDIALALTGVVPGIVINTPNVYPGLNQNITLRGVTSVLSPEPFVVLNGVPVEKSFFEVLDMINPSEIETIRVDKLESLSAAYGSRAFNGVIAINTKPAKFKWKRSKPEKPDYRGTLMLSRQYYQAPLFSREQHNPSGDNSTVYWNGNIYTDEEGKAFVKFVNNKQSSTFRITAEGISPVQGILATSTKRIVTQEDFSVDAKVPFFAGCGDRIRIPVMVKNLSESSLKANLSVDIDNPSLLLLTDNTEMVDIEILSGMTKTVYIPFAAGCETGDVNLTIHAKAGKYTGKIQRQLTIRQITFPYHYGLSGRMISDSEKFNLPDYIAGSLKAEATAYIELTDELFEGAESIFREPSGCFEQLLSSSFPNVFALLLLETAGKTDKPARQKAIQYIENGYRKLVNYEVKKTGGFEWYGGSPAHEMLTAYGLVHFYEMEKIWNKVDKGMTDRALEFLLSRRDGKGGFNQNNGRYGFSGAPVKVNNAYIVYALHEIGKGNLIDKEYETTLKEVWESKDIYRMALLANAAWQRQDIVTYKKLLAYFRKIAGKEDFSELEFQATIVRTYGEAGNREAIAYWLMALLKEDAADYDHTLVRKCLEYIQKGKRGGSFGTTQTTSVCLQALTNYTHMIANSVEGNFWLEVNGIKESIDLSNSKREGVSASIHFANKLKKGINDISLGYSATSTPHPYAVNISWYMDTPLASELCPLKLTTELKAEEIRVDETVRLSVKLQNTEKEAKPMSVAVVGIPGGMSLQLWQLKELLEKEVFDFYEIIDHNLVVYYRELGPEEQKVIDLDLKAEIPGRYKGMASSAYIYYMNKHTYWIDGICVNIKE